jgi:hypothetical protein
MMLRDKWFWAAAAAAVLGRSCSCIYRRIAYSKRDLARPGAARVESERSATVALASRL